MSEIYPPEQVDGGWSVEISHYPESRSIEYHTFDSEKEAQEFYDIVTGVKPPKPSYAALRERLEEAERLLKETNDALVHAFCFKDVPMAQHQYEMEHGRWDGVPTIVETNERFLEENQ